MTRCQAGWHLEYAVDVQPLVARAQLFNQGQQPLALYSRHTERELEGRLLAELHGWHTQKLIDLGLATTGTTPEYLSAIMAADIARWVPIVKA